MINFEGNESSQQSSLSLTLKVMSRMISYRVNPFIAAESNPEADGEEEAGIPVDYYQDQQHDLSTNQKSV